MHIMTDRGWQSIEIKNVIPSTRSISLIEQLGLPSNEIGYYAKRHIERIDRNLKKENHNE